MWKIFKCNSLVDRELAELKSKYSYLINWFWPHKYYSLGALMEIPEGKFYGSPHSFISLDDRCTLQNVTEYTSNKWGITLSILILWWDFYGTLLLNDSNGSKIITKLFTIHCPFYFNPSLSNSHWSSLVKTKIFAFIKQVSFLWYDLPPLTIN